MTFQAELGDAAPCQEPRIDRSVRLVTTLTAGAFHRCMFEHKRPFLLTMTGHAGLLRKDSDPSRTAETLAVGSMAVDAIHSPFQDWMVERFSKISCFLAVAIQAQIGRPLDQQPKDVVFGMTDMTADTGNTGLTMPATLESTYLSVLMVAVQTTPDHGRCPVGGQG